MENQPITDPSHKYPGKLFTKLEKGVLTKMGFFRTKRVAFNLLKKRK
jgi:hypothetical protein